jgi:hypothetical protein
MIEPEHTIPRSGLARRLLAGPSASIRSVHHRTAQPSPGTKRDKTKPPVAFTGSMQSKVVVVSAEQVQRERAQAALPAIRRPRTPSSGLSGRLAFEALFKYETDPSRASEL